MDGPPGCGECSVLVCGTVVPVVLQSCSTCSLAILQSCSMLSCSLWQLYCLLLGPGNCHFTTQWAYTQSPGVPVASQPASNMQHILQYALHPALCGQVQPPCSQIQPLCNQECIFFLPANSTQVSTRVENYEAPQVHTNACRQNKTGEAQRAQAGGAVPAAAILARMRS